VRENRKLIEDIKQLQVCSYSGNQTCNFGIQQAKSGSDALRQRYDGLVAQIQKLQADCREAMRREDEARVACERALNERQQFELTNTQLLASLDNARNEFSQRFAETNGNLSEFMTCSAATEKTRVDELAAENERVSCGSLFGLTSVVSFDGSRYRAAASTTFALVTALIVGTNSSKYVSGSP